MASIISASTTSGTALNMSGDTSGVLQFATGATPTTALTIDTSQNVGIGTASPSSKFNVLNTSSSNNYLSVDIQNTAATSTTVFNNRLLRVASNASGADATIQLTDFTAYNAYIGLNGGNLLFGTNGPTERMRIDSSGNVLVNTTSVISAGKLNINFPSGTDGIDIKFTNASNNGSFIGFFNSTGGLAGVISQTGATTVAYTTSSDYRLKENIVPMTGALDKVLQLKPVTYTWKQDGSDGQGFIAHELQAVVPDAVVGEKDAVETYTDEDGIEQTRIKPQGVDTSFLVATLTAAIQEMKAIIDAQSARITALENK
jgi:hypothetical protein